MPLLANAANMMRIHERRLETVAQNMANVETPGFRRLMVVERELGVSGHVVTRQGQITPSDNPLDVAIQGDAFFMVRDASGQQGLTRNGHLSAGADGFLKSNGLTVVGEQGPIKVGPGALDLRPDGSVWQGGNQVGKVRLVGSPGGSNLAPVGNGVYGTPVALQGSPQATLQIGATEGSNVDTLQEMIHLMNSSRGFEMSGKIAQTDSEIRKKLSDEVGRSR